MRSGYTTAIIMMAGIFALTGCTPSLQEPPVPAESAETTRDAKLFVKDTQVCLWNMDPALNVKAFFGSQTWLGGDRPEPWYLGNNPSQTAGKGGPVALTKREWYCTSTNNYSGVDVAGSVDVTMNITFPNGRSTHFGFRNPSLEAPIFYPSNDTSHSGPGAGQEYKIPENRSYKCSMLGYDFTVGRRADIPGYKIWTVVFNGPAEITDDFDSTICQP